MTAHPVSFFSIVFISVRTVGPIYQSKHGQSHVSGWQDPVAVQYMQETAPLEACYIRSCRASPE